MSQLSSTAQQETYKLESTDTWIALLTIDHPDLTEPVRISSDSVDTDSLGETYSAIPFKFILPSDKEGRVTAVDIQVENVTQLLIPDIRAVNSRATLLIQMVLASDPDVVEVEFNNFYLKKVDYDAVQMTARFVQDSDRTTPFGLFFTPSNAPSVFSIQV